MTGTLGLQQLKHALMRSYRACTCHERRTATIYDSDETGKQWTKAGVLAGGGVTSWRHWPAADRCSRVRLAAANIRGVVGRIETTVLLLPVVVSGSADTACRAWPTRPDGTASSSTAQKCMQPVHTQRCRLQTAASGKQKQNLLSIATHCTVTTADIRRRTENIRWQLGLHIYDQSASLAAVYSEIYVIISSA